MFYGHGYGGMQESGGPDAIAGAFLAFAAMMQKDYGVNVKVALKALALAYELNADSSTPDK